MNDIEISTIINVEVKQSLYAHGSAGKDRLHDMRIDSGMGDRLGRR